MKIIQINAVYGVGSTGHIVRDISEMLTKQGHESYVFWAISCREDSNARFVRIGNTLDHKVHAVLRRLGGRQGWHSKAATMRACNEILQIAPDVVHLHNLHSNYIHLPTLLNFLGEHNIPTLITLHDCWMFTAGACTHYHYYQCKSWTKECGNCPAVPAKRRPSVMTMLQTKRDLYRKIDRLAVNGVSKWTTAVAQASILGTAQNIRCIYNWIDTNIFSPQNNNAEIRKRYAVPSGHKLILGVAQGWGAEKGLDAFIQMADELRDSATVLLAGRDCGVPQMENLRCIGFTNNRQELIDLYSAADVFVNPSKAETFGLVTAEAMACGTPVVAYDNSGTSELVGDSCGALVPDGDIGKLIEQIKNVLQAGKVSYTEACRLWVCDKFEKEKQVQKYIDYYSYLTNGTRE